MLRHSLKGLYAYSLVVLSFVITRLASFNLVLFCLVLSCLVLFCLVLSCPAHTSPSLLRILPVYFTSNCLSVSPPSLPTDLLLREGFTLHERWATKRPEEVRTYLFIVSGQGDAEDY